LNLVEGKDARLLWLRARYELAAGSAEEALRFAEEALKGKPAKALSERIRATQARARLGLGDYASALLDLESLDTWEAEAQAEGLAYRGLGLSLLGKKDEALQALTRGLVSAEKSGDERLQALVGSSLATALWR